KPTQLASPQAHAARTEAAPTSAPDSTTNPYGPQVLDGPRSLPGTPQMTVRIGQAHTMQDGAPAPMTVLPNLSPQPPGVGTQAPIDRRAETHVSAEPSLAAPQHDTVMLPHLAPQPAAYVPPPPPPDHGGVSTFAAQTTDASARRSSQARTL